MRHKHTLRFFISLFFVTAFAQSQEEVATDTLSKKTKYGLRIGADISKPLRSLLEDDYTGFELVADFRLTEKFYAAAEVGNEQKDFFEPNLNATTSGSYAKIGVDLNAHNNWLGLNNAIFGGLRYGFSSFKQELLAYSIYTNNTIFPPSVRIEPREFNGLTAHWVELVLGVKTEVLNNLYLSINVQLKRKLSESELDNFDNIFIPGFNSTNDFSEFGAGYGYSISYLIPLFQK